MNHFEEMYNTPINEIPFNEEWNNGTGYYDFATKVDIPVGVVVKSYDTTSSRKLLLIGTRLGTVVVFERYENGKHGVYVLNAPQAISKRFLNFGNARSSLSQDTIFNLIGTYYNDKFHDNIAHVIEAMYDALVDTRK